MSQRKSLTMGRPTTYITWLSLWMDMRRFSVDNFSRMLCYSEMAVYNWRAGKVMGRHAAQLIRARWPDAPIHLRGGHVSKIHEPLPTSARTPEMYRFLFRKMKYIDPATVVWSVALERARGIVLGESKPKEIPVPGSQVNPDGI